jgi:hypothetical protein
LLGYNGQLGQFGGRDSDAFKALGHDAVGSGEQTYEQVHCRNLPAVVFDSTRLGLAQKTYDIIGKEFSIESEGRLGFALFLVKKLLELTEQFRQIGA